MKAAVQILKKAEELKRKVTCDTLNDNEAWNSHQQLQDIYQQLLVIDLEYALDKKVEQDLWNYVFKNQINALQLQAKDRKNPKRSESQENLVWFLESASGFYLQLLQELCETFELDIPCRRKGPVYGISREIKPLQSDIAPPHKSSCLYICQHCLVHLGDIARYRNQSLQAETFYRHAAELVPSNGQPYNQLAILEAAKGDKLSTVFYYVRSIAVKYPFPVASTNLQKMFSKIANDEFQHEGKSKLSVYDYVTAFLQFHSLVHLTSDLNKAQKLGKVLASNLTVLIATESITAWKLIQMTAINMFAIGHATRTLEAMPLDKKDDEPEALSEEEQSSYNLVLELIASTLNGLLLLVYTMKEDSDLKAYYALPVVKLILEWLRQDPNHLKAAPFTSKLQIWPSYCKLLNALQSSQISGFDINKYVDVPLPEDWDLRSFLPLREVYYNYKFKESLPHFSNDEEHALRTIRLVDLGHWLCEQEIYGVKLMMAVPGKDDALSFEAITPQTPSSDVLKQLEEISFVRGTDGSSALSLVSSSGKQNGTVNVNGNPTSKLENGDCNSSFLPCEETASYMTVEAGNDDPCNGKATTTEKYEKTRSLSVEEPVLIEKNVSPVKGSPTRSVLSNLGRERKTRQNVALQTIMQRKNLILKPDVAEDPPSANKPKSEGKQVTFKTPSPSPPASSGGTPPLPQVSSSTPSPIYHLEMASSFSPLHSLTHCSQQKTKSFGNVSNHALSIDQNLTGETVAGVVPNVPPPRALYPSLPNAESNFNVSSTNKYGYFAGSHVDSRPYISLSPSVSSQQLLNPNVGTRAGQPGNHMALPNKDGLCSVGGNSSHHNPRLGVIGTNSSSLVNIGTSNSGAILGVPQHGLMFGHALQGNIGNQQLHGSQLQVANINAVPSGSIQTPLGVQNRMTASQAAAAAAIKKQQQSLSPYAVNSALFGQSSQPAWFPTPQNHIGVSQTPTKPTNFEQMFPQLNHAQVPPPPLHPVGQLYTNQLLPNQPFGGTQRPQFPHSEQNPFLYQMMSHLPDQHPFPFSAPVISQSSQLHTQTSGSVSATPPSQVSGSVVQGHQFSQAFGHPNITALDEVSSNFQDKPLHVSPTGHPFSGPKSQQHVGGPARMLRNEPQGLNRSTRQLPNEALGLRYSNVVSSNKLQSHSMTENSTPSNENQPSTYSLFNSPWSSGLNLSNSTSRENQDSTSSHLTNSSDLGGFLQPGGLQSLWSGPGPSPLERLLEQQKQKKDPAPH